MKFLEALCLGFLVFVFTVCFLAGIDAMIKDEPQKKRIEFLEQQLENLPDSVKIEYYKIK